MRDELLAELQERIRRFGAEQDADLVLSEDAWNLAGRLLEAVPNPSLDPQVVHALGWLHWCGFNASNGRQSDHLVAALELFRSLYLSFPHSTPATLHGALEELVAPDLNDRARKFQKQYDASGEVGNLDQAVVLAERALRGTPDDNPDYQVYLSSLGIILAKRFKATASLTDINRAIDVAQKAVYATAHDDPKRALNLSNLGAALTCRFEYSGSQEDLHQAVDATQGAVNATDQGDPQRGGRLCNLGAALLRQFGRSGALEDLNRAVEVGEQAVAATPQGHPKRAGFLANLGNALLKRFELQGDPEDLDRGIAAGQEVVKLTPLGHYERPAYLSNLSGYLQLRFLHSHRLEDADSAVQVGGEAVSATSEGHPAAAGYLLTLGNALQERFARTWEENDAYRAMEAYRKAAGLSSGPFDVRAKAALELGRLAAGGERWDDAVEGYSMAIDLVELVASRGLRRGDQEFRLRELDGLGPEAAAACIQAGRRRRAVELFEQGRGVLFSRLLDNQTDLADLQKAHPVLAEEFSRRRDEIDRPFPSLSGFAATEAVSVEVARIAAERRQEATGVFYGVLAEVRRLPGFEKFLAPKPVRELLPAAMGGPVVLINVAWLRSDALILMPGGVDVLSLEGLGPEVVDDQVRVFLEALDQLQDPARLVRTHAETALAEVLGWLWERVTRPVLDHLNYFGHEGKDAKWPHVWWCPSGRLSMLPLHAAGRHDLAQGHADAVIDRVVSSTIPTVRALLHARRPVRTPANGRALIVAMPYTPEQANLPGAAEEANTLQRLLEGRVDVLGLPGTPPATYSNVVDSLSNHVWAHFACHGVSNLADPSASHLLLSDYQNRPLSVVDVMEIRLENVELAFLSACTTARTGLALPDEPIHLAAAYELAGYRHVVACLWPIDDAETAWLCKDFYSHIGSIPGVVENAAASLHHAARRLRATNRAHPSRWAPYTHFGP